jgi:hypothetical protein
MADDSALRISFVIILHPIGHITQFNVQKSMV